MASMAPKIQHCSVFIGNIPYNATEKQLIDICEEIGPVVSFRLVMDKGTGKPKGYGFCEYLDEETARSAQRNLKGYLIRGRQLRVNLAQRGKTLTEKTADPAASQPLSASSALPTVSTKAGAFGGMESGLANQQGPDPLTNYLQKMSKSQVLEILSEIKLLAAHNNPLVRQYLQQNTALLRAQNQVQMMLGLATPATMQMTSSRQQYPSHLGQSETPQQPMAAISVQPRLQVGISNSVVPQNSTSLVQVPLPQQQVAITRPGNSVHEDTALSGQIKNQGYPGRSDPGVGPNLSTAQQPSGAIPVNPAGSQPLVVSSALSAMSAMAGALGEMQCGPMNQQGPDPLTNYLAKMSRTQLLGILSEIKLLAAHNNPLGRQYLQQNPVLLRAQNQAEVTLGLATPTKMQMASSTQQYPSHLGQCQVPQQPMAAVSVQPRLPMENSNSVVQQNLVPLPQHQVPITRPGRPSQFAQHQVPQQPMAAVSVQPRLPMENSNSVVQQNLVPLPQHQVLITRPGRPFQETSQFSYSRCVGAATPVDLWTEVKSQSGLQPTKIRKIA